MTLSFQKGNGEWGICWGILLELILKGLYLSSEKEKESFGPVHVLHEV